MLSFWGVLPPDSFGVEIRPMATIFRLPVRGTPRRRSFRIGIHFPDITPPFL